MMLSIIVPAFNEERYLPATMAALHVAAESEVLLFIDADTIVPESLLLHIVDVMQHHACIGGAVAVEYS